MSAQLTEAIQSLRQAVADDPSAAKATFRAVTVSSGEGFSTDSTIRGFGVRLDEPAQLGGTDTGPNPVEAVLAALGSCQAIVYRAYAAVLGLRIDRLEVDARGPLDVRGFLGVAKVPPGFERVSFAVRIVSPEAPEKIRELARLVDEHCPVLDVLRRPLAVSAELEHVRTAGRDAA